ACGHTRVLRLVKDRARPQASTLSLHDALPISRCERAAPAPVRRNRSQNSVRWEAGADSIPAACRPALSPVLNPPPLPSGHYFEIDRKSTRLNSSHLVISYAVFCLKKKKTQRER